MKTNTDNKEFVFSGMTINGFVMLLVNIVLIPAAIASLFVFMPDIESPLVIVPTVVLCADEPAQPVVNTGSLYN